MNPQTEELACLYVLDRLDARERAAFEARLPREPEMSALLGELETALARRIRSLPQHEPPASLLAEIEARIGTAAGSGASPSHAAAPDWALIARWGIAAVAAVGIAIIVAVNMPRAQAANRPFMIIVGLDSRQSPDARFVQLATLAELYWEKPEELPVKVDSTGQGGRAYALFDPGSNQGFIAIRQFPDVEAGKRYHLWLLDTESGHIREAGILPETDSARGLYFFSVAPATGAKPEHLDFFVTAEDASAPESSQPQGKVVLGDRRI
jgi:anti-sigma-K factor RskA